MLFQEVWLQFSHLHLKSQIGAPPQSLAAKMPGRPKNTEASARVMSYRNARARNEDLSEAHVPDLMALDIEERSWMLRVAAGFNQMSAARALLTARASVDLVTYHACKGTRNALHEACLWRAAVDMVQLLLGHRADVNIKVQYQGHNRTARQIAEAKGFTELARCFEGGFGDASRSDAVPPHPSWRPFSPPASSATPLSARAEVMSYRNARARNQDLSEAHVPDLMALDIEERSWMLRVAAGFNQMSAARALLTARASVDLVTYHACKGTRNALHEACLWRAAVDMVQLLLGHRADVNSKVQYQGHNRTARQIAEAKGFTELVRCFEGGFGDASRSDAVPPHPSWRPFSPPASSATPLSARAEVMSYRNARARNQDLSEAHVPDLMALDIEERSWMLRVAAGFNQMSAARALLTARASVDLVTYHACKGTRNALHEACLWRAAVDMVQLLLGHRADVNIKVQYQGHNRTARQIAEAKGFTELVRCFEGGFGDASRSDAVPPHPSPPCPRPAGLAGHATASAPPDQEDEEDRRPDADEHEQSPRHSASGWPWWDPCDDGWANYGWRRYRVWRSEDTQENPSWSSSQAGTNKRGWASSTWVRTPDDEDGGDFDEHPWSGADERYRSRSPRCARGTCEVIETVPIHRVANLQTWCSPRFKDGRPLESTIHELKEGLVDPLRHPKFILNAVKATVKRHGEQQELYWTEDHRRLFCMRAAGCNQIRVRIPVLDRRVQGIFRKAIDRIGHDTDIHVGRLRSR